ncbi:MAG: ATP-binding protein [Thermosynechococcaceae cyanobacterium]
MDINIRKFFNACNPSRTLVTSNPEDKQYYIDFSEVRGGPVINQLARAILMAEGTETCQLFTGHIGCGKSTELHELERKLQDSGFHVAYCDSMKDLGEGDVEISDILLSITHQVSQSLEDIGIKVKSGGLEGLFKEISDFLGSPVEFEYENKFSLPYGLGQITAKTKNDVKLRGRLQSFLDSKVGTIIDSINQEILTVANTNLQKEGYQGLVVIVDNLEKMSAMNRTMKMSQPEYIFIDRGNELRRLRSHLVYTVPLSLTFSRRFQELVNNFGGGVPPVTLPMVPVQMKNGSPCAQGLKLLRRMVLRRAFPNVQMPEEDAELIAKAFDSPETLDRLCCISGGHVRTLMGLLYGCLKAADPPLTLSCVERVILEHRDSLARALETSEWELLKQVAQQQDLSGAAGHDTLLRSLFVFEYRSDQGRWFGLNPALKELEIYKSWQL